MHKDKLTVMTYLGDFLKQWEQEERHMRENEQSKFHILEDEESQLSQW